MGCFAPASTGGSAAVLHAAHAIAMPRGLGVAPLPTRDAAEDGLLLVGGDEGLVRLHRAPCVVADAPSRSGRAHCDRVASVRFLSDGLAAVSAGKYDGLLVRWEVSQPPRTAAWSY